MLVTVVLLHFSFPPGDGMPKSSKHLQIKANANTKKQVKHAMRYTQYRGLAQVTNWVKLKFAAMNLKKLANWKWKEHFLSWFFHLFSLFVSRNPVAACCAAGFLDRLRHGISRAAIRAASRLFRVVGDGYHPAGGAPLGRNVVRFRVGGLSQKQEARATHGRAHGPVLRHPAHAASAHSPDEAGLHLVSTAGTFHGRYLLLLIMLYTFHHMIYAAIILP